MGRTLGRTAAFRALWRALASGKSGPGLAARFGAMPRMIWATLRGKYDGGGRLFLMALGTLYVVSPVDALPELFLAFAGLIDDLFVVSWIAGAFLAETDRFLEWEGGLGQPSRANPPRQPGRADHGRGNGRPSEVIEGDVVG